MLPLLLTLAIQAAAAASAEPADVRITLDEFLKLYDEGQVLVVDVRGEGNYHDGHIPGAIWIPVDAIETRLDELKGERRPIVTYCS